MDERSTGGDGAPDQVIEITVDPTLAADPQVRAALEHLSQQLAEAELLEDPDDAEVAGFSMPGLGSFQLNKSNTFGPTSKNAGCIGFSETPNGSGSQCTIFWQSCITDGWLS